MSEEENLNKNIEISGDANNIKAVNIVNQVQNAFLDYSMSVIISRAIPDVYDGLKPSHRRVIYSMYESGNTSDKAFRKCARIVGDVIGKYHPHGNEAAYSTLVRLAQPFANRYVLIDGNGNFGSIDGDAPAAMRYTEARLNKLAIYMAKDLEYNVVNYVSNYDGTEHEPVVLPARFPNILVNGSSGIAVGFATNIPPHNLGEVIDATIAIAKNPDLSLSEIMNFLKGPDFPTGGIILNKNGIIKAYETGVGSITIRSKYHFETSEKKQNIIIDEIPYGVNKAVLIEEIALLVKNKIIDGITNLRDETNKDGLRILIAIRHDCIPEIILNHLFKLTQLQKNFGIISLCLENNVPKILPLINILKDYIEFQISIVTKKTNFLLKKEQDRKHIILGLLIAINKINEVIEIIKKCETPEEANKTLINKFNLTETQTQAILSMTLRRLTGLEKNKLNIELAEIEKKIINYQNILRTRENKIEVIINELNEIKNKFSDKRRTEISENLITTINDEDLIPKKEVVVIVTKKGYIKRIEDSTFRVQKKSGKGIKSTTINENDLISFIIHTQTHSDLLLFSNLGLVYRIKGYDIPECSRIAKGIPVQNLLALDKNENIVSIIELKEYNEGFLTFFTKKGLIKRNKISDFYLIQKNGKKAIKLKNNDQLLSVKYTNGKSIISIASSSGRLVSFEEEIVRVSLGRNTSGVIGLRLKNEKDYVVGACASSEGNKILSITQNGYGKITELSKYRLTHRGGKGVFTLKETKKNGCLIEIKTVNGDEDLMLITNNGVVIRVSLTEFRLLSRRTIGIKIINLDKDQKVLSAVVIPNNTK